MGWLAIACLSWAAPLGAGAAAPDEGGLPPLRAIVIEGIEECANCMRPAWLARRKDGIPAAILARDGDLLSFKGSGAEFFLRIREADGGLLAVKIERERLLLGGEVVAVKLPDDAAWLRAASREELAGLRHVEIEAPPGEAEIAALRRLAEANPTVGIAISRPQADGEGLAAAVGFFSPRWFEGEARFIEAEAERILPALRDVELLFLNAEGAKSLAWLPRLPALRSLSIVGWRPKETGPLPPGCGRLRALSLLGGSGPDLSFLGDPGPLRQLFLVGVKELRDLRAIAGAPELESLSLVGCQDVTDLAVLKGLRKLADLGLPPKVSQEAFAEVVRDHPKLRAIELVETEGIIDLAPLRGAKALEMLVLADVPATTTPLWGKESLRFLALPEGALASSPEYVLAFAKAHPRIAVTIGAPVCLGSGWILLLPLGSALAYAIAGRRGRGSARRHG